MNPFSYNGIKLARITSFPLALAEKERKTPRQALGCSVPSLVTEISVDSAFYFRFLDDLVLF